MSDQTQFWTGIAAVIAAMGVLLVKVIPTITASMAERAKARLAQRKLEAEMQMMAVQPTLDALRQTITMQTRRVRSLEKKVSVISDKLESSRRMHEECMRQNLKAQITLTLLEEKLELRPGGRRKTDPPVGTSEPE